MELYGVRLMVVNLGALVLLNFWFLYLFGYWFRSHKLERQLAEFQMQNELQYRYYAELEQKYRESRKIMHDMKNHLQAVEHLYQAKDGQEQGGAYVKDLYHMLNLLGEKYYSSNRMLNIISVMISSQWRGILQSLYPWKSEMLIFRICGILILRRFSPICWIMHWKRWRLMEREPI